MKQPKDKSNDSSQAYWAKIKWKQRIESKKFWIDKYLKNPFIFIQVKPSRKIGQLSFIQFCKFKLFNYEKKKLHRKQNPFDHQAV